MTREEITALAREAGFIEMGGQHGALRRFALLVQAREREACASLIEPKNPRSDWTEYAEAKADCAAMIRARGAA